MSPCSYYDVDAILAEEELVPCTNLFDFSHLAHLDPDAPRAKDQHYLPEGSRIKMPMWAMEKWAMLGFVRVSLPRHYGRKARERLGADPGDADLRKRNERFFSSGRMLVDLIENSSQKVAKSIASTRRSARRTKHTEALEQVSREAQELKTTLVKTFSGERLRRTFDWALSSGGDDDVSLYLSKLTEMEQRLFYCGSLAVAAHQQWMLHGNRRLIAGMPKPVTTGNCAPTPSATAKNTHAVTPGLDDDDEDGEENYDGQNPSTKRRRVE